MRVRMPVAVVVAVAAAVGIPVSPASAALPGVPIRIVGGGPAGPAPYLAQVFDVRPAQGDVFQCGGTLVADSWVLTARHCLADAGETTAIRIGRTELGGGTRIAVDESRTPPAAGDVALLHLAAPVDIAPVGLASTDPALPTHGTMYGWGAEAAEAPGQPPVMSPVLKQASTFIFTDENADGDGGPGLSSWSLGGTGAGYKGDSGGPLIVDGTQVGVISTSVGAPRSDGFNDHASVARNRDWIRSVTGA
ncbi:S1 family peptidase [Actinoplanes sp. NPDC049265]|uniref:S1 family peptidase n=1 Tax=Actinoplanes sp. NPDC049265 TaxID=3363902 RepID=UPI0037223082